MAERLTSYNNALRMLGEQKLASLDEDREPRRHLDDAWDDNVQFCLEQGDWNFATRSVCLNESSAVDAAWEGVSAHRKPDDWVRTISLGYYEFGDVAADVRDQGGFWICRKGPLYARYVSDGAQYGRSLGDWPQTFTTYVETRLALLIAERIRPGNERTQTLFEMTKRALYDAQNRNATDQGARTIPLGRLARARGSGAYGVGCRWERW